MKSRNIRIVRYADDILIFARTRQETGRYQQIATVFLEGELKLTVNAKKTHIASVQEGVAYLGLVIYPKYVAINKKKIKAFKDRVRQLTPRNHGMNVEAMIVQLNPVLRGWANYFRVANCKGVFQELMQWIRRRLRMKKMKPTGTSLDNIPNSSIFRKYLNIKIINYHCRNINVQYGILTYEDSG